MALEIEKRTRKTAKGKKERKRGKNKGQLHAHFPEQSP